MEPPATQAARQSQTVSWNHQQSHGTTRNLSTQAAAGNHQHFARSTQAEEVSAIPSLRQLRRASAVAVSISPQSGSDYAKPEGICLLTSSPLRPCTDADSYGTSDCGSTCPEHLPANITTAKLRSICIPAPDPLVPCADGDSDKASEF